MKMPCDPVNELSEGKNMSKFVKYLAAAAIPAAIAALPALAQDPVLPAVPAIHPVPTLGELPPPESLRPCCAFGDDLHVRAAGIRFG